MKNFEFRSPELAEKAKQSLTQSSSVELEIVLRDSTWVLRVENIVIKPAKNVITPPDVNIYLVLNTDTISFVHKVQRMSRRPVRPNVNLYSVGIQRVVCEKERQHYLEITGDSMSDTVRFYPQVISFIAPPREDLT